jgi:hypothetical protein
VEVGGRGASLKVFCSLDRVFQITGWSDDKIELQWIAAGVPQDHSVHTTGTRQGDFAVHDFARWAS